ncbi:MAG: cell wall-binding repeat-containing protein [bacterium]|nr:cell wall-binding repeat-containing protein [bacterium]
MAFKRTLPFLLCLSLALALASAIAFADGAETTEIDPVDETYIATDAEIEYALANGVEGMPEISDTLANEVSGSEAAPMKRATKSAATYKVATYSGKTRYDTSAQIARAAFPDGVASKTAILAGGDAWADALSASTLAGAIDCPILLTPTANLSAYTISALEALGIESVIIVGGEVAVSEDVVTEMEESSITVTRLCGETRYETCAAIYEYGLEQGFWDGSQIIFASGGGFADALSISPVAFKEVIPIILTPKSGILDEVQTSLLDADTAFSKAIVVGGEAAVSKAIYDDLTDRLEANTGSADIVRLYGANRYVTSGEIAKWAVEQGYLTWNNSAFASGTAAPDALSGGPLQGKRGATLLLISKSNEKTLSYIPKSGTEQVFVLGGKAAVRPSTRNSIAYTLGFKLTDIEGFKLYLDAGHGWNNRGNNVNDPGACKNGYQEYRLTKELANLVAKQLRSTYGIEVFVNDDGGPYYLRHSEAVALDCNAIVSIHFNSSESSSPSGTESYIHSTNASKWSSKMRSTVHNYLVEGTGLKDRGKLKDEFAILSGELPACLLEVCFVSNKSDMKQYESRKDIIVEKLAEGIYKM